MPRRNKTPLIKRQPFTANDSSNKQRYPSRSAAEQAASEAMRYHDIQLRVYQATDGGWYLTSAKPRD